MLLLLALCTGVGAVQGRRFLERERFRQEGRGIATALHLAKELSLDYGCDVALYLEKKGPKLSCALHIPLALSKQLQEALSRSLPKLEGVEALLWEGQAVDHLTLLFESPHLASPRGTLAIRGYHEELSWRVQ